MLLAKDCKGTKSRRKSVGHVALAGRCRNACRVFVGKPEADRQVGRPCCIWDDNIKMDFKETW
jgi:ferredoxin-thioredoxin reductase catalytic subunit